MGTTDSKHKIEIKNQNQIVKATHLYIQGFSGEPLPPINKPTQKHLKHYPINKKKKSHPIMFIN